MTRRVPKFVALPPIPEGLPPQQRAYFEALHAVLRTLIEPMSELGGRTSISLDDHITNTNRDDHTQYLNVARHDTPVRHPLGSVLPTSDTPPPAIGGSSQVGTLNAVARADHTHAHGDLSALSGTHHHWNQIAGKPTTFPPSPHTHPLSDLQQSGATTGQVPKWSGTAWQAANVNWTEVANKPTQFPPTPHKSTHAQGGSDPLTPADIGAVANAGNTPSIQAGTEASRPAAGTAGRIYIATDTQRIYRDTGTSWVLVGVVNWTDVQNKPSTFPPSAHAASHTRGGTDIIAASRLYSGPDANKPASGNTVGDVWWASDTGTLYVWDGTQWKPVGAGATLNMFTGIVAKDYTPPAQSYPVGVTQLVTYDVGTNGWLMPVYVELPPGAVALKTGVRFVFHDGGSVAIENSSTSATLTSTFDQIVSVLMTPTTNGKAVRQILFYVFNGQPSGNVQLGTFKVRAYAFPKGSGAPL